MEASSPLVHYPPPPPAVPAGEQLRRALRALDVTRAGRAPAFLVLSQGRSGSTLLTDLLSSVDGVVCDREVLAAPVWSPALWVRGLRHRHPDATYGFKVKIYQLTRHQGITDPGRWLRGRARTGWRVVHLRRENLLRQVLSNARLWQTSVTHRTGDDAAAVHEPMTIEVPRLLAYLDARRSLGRAEDAALQGIPHLRLSYERDLLDPGRHASTVARVLAHVGHTGSAVVPHTALVRTSVDDLGALVANLDEVAAALRGTPYASMLHA